MLGSPAYFVVYIKLALRNVNSDTPESNEVVTLIGELKRDMVDSLEGFQPGAGMRDVHLFDLWRQLSLRRIIDLAEAAEQLFQQERLVPGCTLTRSVVETVAIQYLVWKRLSVNVESDNAGDAHTTLMSVVFGRRDKGDDWSNKSVHVLTAIGHLDKEFPGFQEEYARHSEYAHPGIAGGFGTYVRLERPTYRAHFERNPSSLPMDPWGRGELLRALLVATTYNGFLRDMRPNIVAVMTSHAGEAGDDGEEDLSNAPR